MQANASQSSQPVSQDRENPGGFTHIPALDGIRGLAILLVLVDHLFWANDHTGHRILDILSAVRASTYCGVNLFFALSGFLITGILFDTLRIPHYFRTFYARRTLRIFPLYYGALLALLLLTRPMHFVWSGWQYYYLTYSTNLATWRAYAPLHLGFFNINHFWSLQVEEQFYLVWPLVIYRVRKPESIARIALISCAVVLAIRVFLVVMRGHPGFENEYLTYGPTYSCADNILFGCCLSALLRTRWRQNVLRLAPKVLIAAAGIMLLAGIRHHGLDWSASRFIPTLGFSLIGIACASAIAMALIPGSKTQSIFSNSILRFFGRYSYGLYVYHYSISGLLMGPLRSFLDRHLHSKGLGVLLEGLIAGAISVLAAMLSYHLYEVKFLRLKRLFSYNRAPASQ
jgi:peptidoglycan/LPS O-acetylase OafA/YrhL